MHHVFYAGTTVTTGDDLAAALLAVVMRVSQSGRAELAEVPCRGVAEDTSIRMAMIVVTPSTPIAAVKFDDIGVELVDPQAVKRLLASPEAQVALPHEPHGSFVEPGTSYDFDEWI